MVKAKLNPKKLSRWTLLSVVIPLTCFALYNLVFSGKVFPGISVAGIYLGGLTPSQATKTLAEKVKMRMAVSLAYGGEDYQITTREIGLNYHLEESAWAAYETARSGNILFDFAQRLAVPFTKTNLGLRISVDENKLVTEITAVSDQISIPPVYPSVKAVAGEIVVDKGKSGTIVDRVALRTKIGQALAFSDETPIAIPVKDINPALSGIGAEMLKLRAAKLLGKSLNLKLEDKTYPLTGGDFFSLLSADGSYSEKKTAELASKIATEINRLPLEPVFVFENTKVAEFAPAKDGITVKEELLKNIIIGNLTTLESSDEKEISVDIPVTKTAPETATKDINNLGIKEMIGHGVSKFAGSIPNRIHNISLATSKFKGVLIAPGETFSFNDTIGDVSEATGFKQAYIIKEGKTILGDGGGVCQVSTTFFRAILAAGLPVLERAAHAYRVGYYEQNSPPGFDATVFSPHPDLKFKNDTPGYILIQPTVDTKNVTLAFDLYGTNDGRTASTSKPVVTDQVAPGEDLYVDDPTLPAGVVKQTEHKAWGAKVTLNYQVSRGGEIIYKKTFISSYQPWQAVYLRGTAQ